MITYNYYYYHCTIHSASIAITFCNVFVYTLHSYFHYCHFFVEYCSNANLYIHTQQKCALRAIPATLSNYAVTKSYSYIIWYTVPRLNASWPGDVSVRLMQATQSPYTQWFHHTNGILLKVHISRSQRF